MPQNTVEAIKAAYDAGAQMVETDFWDTDAGDIICLHDIKAMKTMTSDAKDPRKITAADRARINLGEKAKLPRPYRIPLLQDVLAVVPKDRVLQAEIKGYSPAYAEKFVAAMKAAGLTPANFVVSSFQFQALKDFRAKHPEFKTLWLGCGVKASEKWTVAGVVAKAKEGGFDIVCPGCEAARKAGLKPADADAIRAAGFDFRVYGVNSLESLRYAASLKATGFTCNTFKAAYGWAKEIGGIELLPHRN